MQNELPLRRDFLKQTGLSAAALALLGANRAPAQDTGPAQEKAPAGPKVKVGIIGGGHRGNLIGGFMKNHGGYEFHAVADYFPAVADKLGETFGVGKSRRFSGLSGYKKVLESGVEALAILDVPYFYPEQAKAAVDAGCHVYIAKPVAVDVPGTLTIEAAAQEATKKKRCFLVDYQLPLDPANLEVINRVRAGGLGRVAHMLSLGKTGAWNDPPKGPTIENRLQGANWLSDTALCGDTIVSFDIHIIDPLVLIMGKRVVSACGASRTIRPEPHGDRVDALGVIFEFDDGVLWTHMTQSLNNNAGFTEMSANLYGLNASAYTAYSGKVFVRGGEKHYVGDVSKSIYNDGAQRNVADFHHNITEGHFENTIVKRAVDGHLTAILGREAAARHCRLTMDELIKENKKLEIDLTGLKA